MDRAGYRTAFRLGLTGLLGLGLLCGCAGRRKSHLEAGIEKLREGDYEAATTLLELAAEADSESASVHCNLGLAYWRLEQTNRAIQEFKIADRLSKGDERPLEFLGQIYLSQRNLPEARHAFEAAAQLAPLSPRILTSQALVANYGGDFEQARGYLENALELDSGYLPALFNMGLLHRGPLDNKEVAAEYFGKYFRLAPDGPRKETARRLLGLPPPESEPAKPAPAVSPPESPPPARKAPPPVERTKPASAVPPVDPVAAAIEGSRRAVQNQELDTALILLTQAVKQHPENADVLWLLGELYAKHLSYHEKADETYQQFRRRFPNDPRTASISPSAPTPPAAPPPKPSARKTDRDPEAALQALHRGVRFYQAREWQNAIVAYKEALQFDDSTTDALYNLGLTYRAAGDTELARDTLEQAVRQNPDMMTARYMLAVVYRDLKENTEALKQLDVVLENDPHYSKAHLLIGLIYREQGRSEDARKHIQRYVNMEPDSPFVEELKEWLRSSGQ